LRKKPGDRFVFPRACFKMNYPAIAGGGSKPSRRLSKNLLRGGGKAGSWVLDPPRINRVVKQAAAGSSFFLTDSLSWYIIIQ
jgi:hypothetical protein